MTMRLQQLRWCARVHRQLRRWLAGAPAVAGQFGSDAVDGGERAYLGYFQHRWTDQPVYGAMLGMWHNLSDREVSGQEQPHAVCNLVGWRHGRVMEHY